MKNYVSYKYSTLRYFFAMGIIIFVMSCNRPSGIRRVWAIDDSEKIKKDDICNPLANDQNNTVWNNKSVILFGGRNEIVAFQLIIEADTMGVDQVNVRISDLKNGYSVIHGSETGSSDPFDYRGRNVELFTAHYLNITKRTPPLWFFADSMFVSDYYSGWIPDCLIPFAALSGKGGAPFSIEGDKNQAVWIDILIPKSAPAGTYIGNAIVTISGIEYQSIPISLTVYNFTLPDSIHLKNMFGYHPNDLAKRHNVSLGSEAYYNLEARYYQMAHRHRFDLATRVKSLDVMSKKYKRYFTGEIYTEDYHYAGPGENTGNTTFSIGFGGDSGADSAVDYGKTIRNMTQDDWWKGANAWEDWFIKNAPGVARHKYLFPDEPDWKGPDGFKGTGSIDTIIMQSKWSHSNPGIGRHIPTFVTNRVKPRLKGHVDFWSISGQEFTIHMTPEDIADERAHGKKFSIYNGFRPGMGAVISDVDAVDFRVMPWIVWKYNLDQYFYWSTTHWTKLNVFVNPLTFDDVANSDGTFFYPGQDALYPEENRNLSGPLSSIRAKNWRRGAQDYEYLWLAKSLGLQKELDSIVNKCVPAALWEAKNQKDISWPKRGYSFEEYRKQLAELLSKQNKL